MNNLTSERQTVDNSRYVNGQFAYLFGLYALCLVAFSAMRLLLWWRNADFASETTVGVISKSFVVGLRFDLAVGAYLMMPLLLALVLLPSRGRMWARRAFLTAFSLIMLLGMAEAEFYREFSVRFNNLVFEYLKHAGIVSGMIWDGYPVLRYLAVWAVLTGLFLATERWWWQRCLSTPPLRPGTVRRRLKRGVATVMVLIVLVFAARGGIAGEPLRWGDAFFSEVPFANHLALNGLFTLGRSAWDTIYSKHSFWVSSQPKRAALATTNDMLRLSDEAPLATADYPLLRRPGAAPTGEEHPRNVVVILMESFAGRYCGALGDNHGLTPEFDRLAGDGILFTRAFANGTHTHQGVYATLTSFPNLPGYEFLMKMMEASQEFSGLPSLLERHGYQSVFLYNGLFSWDNKEGFFRNHGIDRFIGTDDYRDPVFRDPVWGVSDLDVYRRANQEFRSMAVEKPFLGVILTLSNHSPFNLPDPLPFPRIVTGDHLEGRFNAMRYADWALGEFFRQASREEYFKDTLFVITGDHGYAVPPNITPMALTRFHVPLLFYAPGRLASQRRDTVASQVDIGPSVMGLVGINDPTQAWGRNLFSPALNDPGFAVIKPSGSEEVVALIEDDWVLIRAPKSPPQLFRYALTSPPTEAVDETTVDPERVKQMDNRLLAYVQTGILTLRGRQLGLPPYPYADYPGERDQR
jgi:phosphoglycerol transferase MdoB-like AlkP superfamily enzyme